MSTRTVDPLEDLVALVGEPSVRVRDKGRDALSDVDRDWLAPSPFCVLGTADGAGRRDAAPRGDPAGWLAHVVDDRTVAVAARPGNRRVDGYRNVLENPSVGLLLVIAGRGDAPRVNGRARLVSDAPWFDDLEVRGHRPLLAVEVAVEAVLAHDLEPDAYCGPSDAEEPYR